LTEYLYQNGLAYFHTPSAVLRNQTEDLLNYYGSEVDDSIDRSKDLNNTYRPDTSVPSPSPIEEGQEIQEEVTQRTQSDSKQFPRFSHDFVSEEIISRYGAKKEHDRITEQ